VTARAADGFAAHDTVLAPLSVREARKRLDRRGTA
jgi:hypothetical protein